MVPLPHFLGSALAALAIIALLSPSSRAALSTIHVHDTFDSGSGDLNGKAVETGDGTWVATNRLQTNYQFYPAAGSGNAITRGPGTEGGVPTRQAVVAFDLDSHSTITRLELEADLRPSVGSTAFTGIGFISGFESDYTKLGLKENMLWSTDNYGTAPINVLLFETGFWDARASTGTTTISLGSGTLPAFSPAGFTNVRIGYNVLDNTVDISVDGIARTLDTSDLDDIGFIPDINYAGMQIRYFGPAGGVTPGGVDNFVLSSIPEPTLPLLLLPALAAALVRADETGRPVPEKKKRKSKEGSQKMT